MVIARESLGKGWKFPIGKKQRVNCVPGPWGRAIQSSQPGLFRGLGQGQDQERDRAGMKGTGERFRESLVLLPVRTFVMEPLSLSVSVVWVLISTIGLLGCPVSLRLPLMVASRGDGSDCRLEAKSKTMLTFCSYIKPPRPKPSQGVV